MSADETNQSGSDVGGDQVGRDKIVHIKYEAPSSEQLPRIKELEDAFEAEVEENAELGVTIAALQHFLDSVDGPEAVGVEAKLTLGDRTEDVPKAERLKELFAKKVHRRQFSITAQKGYAYLLGSMNQRFTYEVRPLIQQSASKAEVDRSVYERVIKPIGEVVEAHRFPLMPHEIEGMLYFLTGNCHISWH